MSKRYSSKSTPADLVAGWPHRQGIDVDPLRLEERHAAERARERREFDEFRCELESLAAVVKRSRRQCEVEEYAYRARPNQDSLQRAQAAQLARKRAEDQLLEATMQDRELYRALLRD